MGKSLIIKGADFSANGIQETLPSLDITEIVASSAAYNADISIGSYQDKNGTPNTKRCCVVATSFSTWGIDVSQFSKIEVTIKQGYDYVFGLGTTPGNSANWYGWNKGEKVALFNWVTDNQKEVVSLDNTMLAMSLNLRHDDNTTTFPETTALTDIVESIVLVP